MNIRQAQDLHERFTLDHAAFVEAWTKENIEPGNNLGMSTLAAGMGASAGIFCATISKMMGVKKETLRGLFITHLDKNMGEASTSIERN